MKSGYKEIGFGKQTIAKVFEEWYTVPSYQRHYVWESDNVNDMLEDFAANYIEHDNEEYFLGSYIIMPKSKSPRFKTKCQKIIWGGFVSKVAH